MFLRTPSRLAVGLAAAVAAGLLLLALRTTAAFETLERRTGDYALRIERALTGGGIADSTIVIVDIDNRSLRLYQDDLGRWPWPRNAHGAILEFLRLGGARIVGYDVLFSEPDLARPAADSLFLAAAAGGPPVVHAVVFDEAGGDPALATRFERAFLDRRERLDRLEGFALPVPAEGAWAPTYAVVDPPLAGLLATAAGVGAINRGPEPDAIARREHLAARYRGLAYPGMALALALDGIEGYASFGLDARGRPTLRGRRLPLEAGRLRAHWRGAYAEEPYRVIPAHDVLNAYAQIAAGTDPDLDPDVFAGKTVLVGSSAVGVGDLLAGPFSAAEPGVFLHATLLDTLRSGDFLRALPGRAATALALLVTLATGLVVARVEGAGRSTLAAATIVAAVVAAGLGAFLAGGIVAPIAAPVTGVVLAYAGAMAGGYLTEGRRHREVRRAFGKFVPPTVVDAVASESFDLHRAVERRHVTVLFSDIRGFTARAERSTPELVVDTLNQYLTAMVDVVFRHGGTLDKYIGDGLMAFFGAPIEDVDHAVHACRAALEMLERLDELNRGWVAEGRSELAIGIGIHTGEAVIGFVGDPDRRMDYTAIGDTVNVASRLEALTKELGVTVLASAATVGALDGALPTEPLGRQAIKGRAEPIEVYALTRAARSR